MLRVQLSSTGRRDNTRHGVGHGRWLRGATCAAWCLSYVLLCLPGQDHICTCLAEEPMHGLPRPHFRLQPDDPPWLGPAVQFHGHLGPWAAAGLRMGMAAREAAGAKGYFDLEVEAQGPLDRPPRSCLLDGLQVSTGATLGKRNLHWQAADELVVRARNLKTGVIAEVRPTAQLHAWLGTVGPQTHGAPASSQHESAQAAHQPATPHGPGDEHSHDGAATAAPPADQAELEAVARRIATAAEHEIMVVRLITPDGQPTGK